jgi:hypothetical protein
MLVRNKNGRKTAPLPLLRARELFRRVSRQNNLSKLNVTASSSRDDDISLTVSSSAAACPSARARAVAAMPA